MIALKHIPMIKKEVEETMVEYKLDFKQALTEYFSNIPYTSGEVEFISKELGQDPYDFKHLAASPRCIEEFNSQYE